LAINKRKVLDSARKYVQKGAKQKALKEYEKLLKLDPRDGKLRLEIGDAHRRWGQIDEATGQYTKVAEQYKQDGFDARAVAVYKQVLNLDSKRYSSYVALAELYQRMGLDSEAISALQTAADGYHKEGQKREALELLRKMATLDPTNTTSRMKVADLLRQEGMEEDAVSEYEAVAEELLRQESHESVPAVYARILEIKPKRVDIMVATARLLIQLRQAERAEAFARQAIEAEPDDIDHYELLCELYKTLGRVEELSETTRDLARIYRERGDEDRAREIMQRVPALDSFEVGRTETEEIGEGEALEIGGEDDALGDDDLLDDEFLATDGEGDQLDGGGYDDDEFLAAEDDATPSTPEGAGGEEAATLEEEEEEELPQGDPDQLFAEATVYLRYGKRRQATASLRGIVAQEPDHRGALEKLGEIFAEDGEPAQAVEHWLQAAHCAQSEGDAQAFEILRDRIATLDAEAADSLESMASAAEMPAEESNAEVASEPSPPELDPDLPVESESAPELDPDLPVESPSASGLDFDLPVEADEQPEACDQVPESPDVEIDIDLDVDEPGGEPDDLEAEEASPAKQEAAPETEPAAEATNTEKLSPGDSESTTTSEQISDDLEEAEFYFKQGLLDEAEAIYQRVLEAAPNHPSALLRVGEIASARGEDPSASSEESPVEIAVEDDLEVEIGAQAEMAVDDDTEAGIDPLVDLAEDEDVEISVDEDVEIAPDDGIEVSVDEDVPVAVDAEVDVDEGIDLPGEEQVEIDPNDTAVGDDQTEVAEPIEFEAEEGSALSTPTLQEAVEPGPEDDGERGEPQQVAPADRVQQADETQPLTESEGAEDDTGSGIDEATFDLAAELREAFEEKAPEDPNAASGVLSSVEDGFESLFSDFKKGVSQTLSEGDTETRYDLGIAYREMGLYEDAIAEFRLCLNSPERLLDSLSMMGLCALDVGRAEDAVSHFEQALATGDCSETTQVGLSYDLARALEMAGDRERSLRTYRAVAELDPDFQDVGERITALSQCDTADDVALAEAEPEDFESFDDLTAEAEEQPAEAESFESFDDVLSEAETLIEEGDMQSADPGATRSEEPESTQSDDPGSSQTEDPGSRQTEDPGSSRSGGRKRRKKKISFV
jgi:tetratricopeptide (TPR) repeat protein